MGANVGHVDRVPFSITTSGLTGSFQFSPFLYAQVVNRQITPLGGAAGATYTYNAVDEAGDIVDIGQGGPGQGNFNGLSIYVGNITFTLNVSVDGTYRCKIWLIN